jgi:hypothetical protein
MEREGVEKAGGWRRVSVIQGMGIGGGKAVNLEKMKLEKEDGGKVKTRTLKNRECSTQVRLRI